jgi:hypothetical protein
MNKQQIIQLLTLLSSAFPSLAITDDKIDSWLFILADENPQEMLLAARHLAKTKDSSFAPVPSELINYIKSTKVVEMPSADLAWNNPEATELGAEAWKIWGGDSRWGMMPDPKYSENPQKANQTLSFAKAEFIKIYEALLSKSKHQQVLDDHTSAVKALEGLQSQGIDLVRLLK